MRHISNTFLREDPLTGRMLGEACFNGQHRNGVDSLCRAVACKCVCHDAKPKRERRTHAEPTAPPITADKLGAA